MSKSKAVLMGIVGIVFLSSFTLGVIGFIRGVEESRDTVSSDAVDAFQTELTTRGIGRVGQPIEGFDAFLLLRAFPGLQESDFDGVQTREGIYAYDNGALVFSRTRSQPITSAEQAVSREGYETLLETISTLLGLPADDAQGAIAIIDAIDVSADWATSGDAYEDITFRYPERLGTEYVIGHQWPPTIEVRNGEFDCDGPRVIYGRAYCVGVETEGAAGSVYTDYTYLTMQSGHLLVVSFTVRTPQCVNYSESQRSACEREQESFDPDVLIELMVRSIEGI